MSIYIRTSTMLGLGVAGLMVFGEGCRVSKSNPMHCANNDGDDYCAAQSDGSKPFCQRGTDECITPDNEYGCVAERPADECYSPCGGQSSVLDNDECLMMEELSSGSSSSGTTTEESGSESSSGSSTTGPMPCLNDEECMTPDAPFCGTSGECGACDGTKDPDGACAGLDPGMPLCVDGTCVQCTAEAPEACTGETPVCDDATNTCVPCIDHDECGEAACNLFTGACLPGDAVVHVGGAMSDFPTINAAVLSFDPLAEGTIIVHAGDYNESVTVDGGRVLAFLAAELGPGVDPPRWVRNSGSAPQLTVGDATVLMDGLQVSGNASNVPAGVQVGGGQVWVDRSRIVDNNGGGIVAQNAAELVLRNCFVGGDNSDVNALEVNGATADVSYTTLAAGFGSATALTCDGGATVVVNDSLLVARANTPEVVCTVGTIEHSAAEAALGGTNTTLGEMTDTSWFVSYGEGNFHLATPPITIANAAQWNDGDPPTDIDGDLRPTVDGTADFAGADIP